MKKELEIQTEIGRTLPPRGNDSSENATQLIEPLPTSSSAEYIVGEIRQHKFASVAALLILLLTVGGLSFWYFGRHSVNIRQIESIAVMPFVNESGSADVEYLSDGMTETLISSLSQIPKLNVKARSSVFRYKGKERDAQTVGKELNVQAILNGNVVQRASELAVHIELVDAQTETILWSTDYKRPMTNLVSLQSDIAHDVLQKLKTKLSAADEQKLAKKYTENAEAYQLFLKGRFSWNQSTEESLKRSIEYYKLATEKDPNYALAYASLADSYVMLGWDYRPPKEMLILAKEAATKALQIDESLASGHISMGSVKLFLEWDWPGAKFEAERAKAMNASYDAAIEMYTDYGDNHHFYCSYLDAIGLPNESIREIRTAKELDPLSPMHPFELAFSYYYLRDYTTAMTEVGESLDSDPRFYMSYVLRGAILEQKGMSDEAISALYKAKSLEGGDAPLVLAELGYALGQAGKKAEAIKIIAELQRRSKDMFIDPYNIGVIYIALGDKDQAFTWLKKAYEEHSVQMIYLNVEPKFDPIRSDPRFLDLERRIGLLIPADTE